MAPATASHTPHSPHSHPTLTRMPVYSPTYTFSTPVVFSHAKPSGLSKVAERALPPSPVLLHDPVPRNDCTTPPAVMRRAEHPANDATTRLPSGSNATEMGSRNCAALTWRPFPASAAVPSPPRVVMIRVTRSTDRRRWLYRSQMTNCASHTATPSGRFSFAETAAPPSPLLPLVPALFTHVSTSPAAPDGEREKGGAGGQAVTRHPAPSPPRTRRQVVQPHAVIHDRGHEQPVAAPHRQRATLTEGGAIAGHAAGRCAARSQAGARAGDGVHA
jgi:hypothetical protein